LLYAVCARGRGRYGRVWLAGGLALCCSKSFTARPATLESAEMHVTCFVQNGNARLRPKVQSDDLVLLLLLLPYPTRTIKQTRKKMHRPVFLDERRVCVADVNVPPLALQAHHAAAPCIKKEQGRCVIGRPVRSPPRPNATADGSKGHGMRRAITWSQLTVTASPPPAASAKRTWHRCR